MAAVERRRESAAPNQQAESYLEPEHNARWAALGIAHATSGITANVLTLLLPRSIPARNQLNPYLQGAHGKEVEQCPTSLQGQVNPLASSETTVLKTRFGPGDAGDPLSRSIAFEDCAVPRLGPATSFLTRAVTQRLRFAVLRADTPISSG